jgi:hypothetical protein
MRLGLGLGGEGIFALVAYSFCIIQKCTPSDRQEISTHKGAKQRESNHQTETHDFIILEVVDLSQERLVSDMSRDASHLYIVITDRTLPEQEGRF